MRSVLEAFLLGKLNKLNKANIRLYETLHPHSLCWLVFSQTFCNQILQSGCHDSLPEQSEPVDHFKGSLLLLLVDLQHRDEILGAAGVDCLSP